VVNVADQGTFGSSGSGQKDKPVVGASKSIKAIPEHLRGCPVAVYFYMRFSICNGYRRHIIRALRHGPAEK
jgi:hypothetical protein